MQDSNEHRFGLGEWIVEPRLNQISRDGQAVTLRPRTMDLLVYLSSRPGDVVSFDDILNHVWKGAFVSDSSVYSSVNDLWNQFSGKPRCG